MLAIALALGAALGWGSSDFLGGLKSRTVPLLQVLLISQVTALVAVVALVAFRGAGPPATAALAPAALAGTSEVIGIAALYRGLAVGTMSIVAPCAATAPVVPLLAGLVVGEVPGPVQGAGIALAVIGIVVASFPAAPDGNTPRAAVGPSIGYGVLAAAGFGAFFSFMDRSGDTSVPWALLGARMTALTLIAVSVAMRRPPMTPRRANLPVIAGMGFLIVAADTMYTAASTHGLVGVVAVLGSLHTVVTLALARVFLQERLARPQQAGVLISLLGVLVISTA
ncbi:EamA family transporter [Spirillospora sp. CA-142024]|uniref:EamA family transporter n=1 Tax=Spirillospora sp. CA-142024 TaxID=3240036 RepID=UPI003D922A6E